MALGVAHQEYSQAPGTRSGGGNTPQSASGAQLVSGFKANFTGDHQANMLALIGGTRWSDDVVSFSFPDQTSDYSSLASTYGNYELTSGFDELNSVQKTAARNAFDMVESYTELTFNEITGNEGSADIRMAESAIPSTAWAYYPSDAGEGGDAWFNSSGSWYINPVAGTYGNHTFIHEIGHSLGLKHGHDSSGYGKLQGEADQMAYSVMTYKSHQASGGTGYTNEYYGYAQTFMAYDIAALQALYGVNWSYRSTDTTYAFSSTTGEMSVNGTGQGAPASNRIFSTIWDAGGEDTIDLSNYDTGITADLNSGGSVAFSPIQTAQLSGGIYADANLYLAVSPNNKKAGLIENITTGKGIDTIEGNKTSNTIETGGKSDYIYGGGGDDFLFGGGGRDHIVGGPDDDVIDGGIGRDLLKGSGGADTFILNERSSKDVVVDFMIGVDIIDVPDVNLASLTVSNTGHLTVEYQGAQLILRHLDTGDATLGDLIV